MNPDQACYRFRVPFDQTDPGGRLFFGHLLFHAHRAYETFARGRGQPLSRWLQDAHPALPIRHAEADFLAPLLLDDSVAVTVHVERLGGSSFTLTYAFHCRGRLHATARTVHVAVDHSGRPTPLPEELREALRGAS